MAKLGIEAPITIKLPDNWKEQILERIKADGDWQLVTRCADCQLATFNQMAEFGEKILYCTVSGDIHGEDFYCAYGRRKEQC